MEAARKKQNKIPAERVPTETTIWNNPIVFYKNSKGQWAGIG
jgi:hypothetical protein